MRKFILFLVFFFCFNEYAFSKATLKQTVSAPHNNDRFYRGITFNNDGLLKAYNIKVSRLSQGLPVGGHLEYIDEATLEKSFIERIEIN